MNERRIVILGGGESGAGAAILAKQNGFDVFVSDLGAIKENYKAFLAEYSIEFEEQQHSEDRILSADVIIKSPGIPHKAPIVQAALKLDIPIISEIEFASRYTDGKIVAITGSNGKTTTTSMTYEVLKHSDENVGLAGNIGDSFALQLALEGDKDIWVLELSSFQLDDIRGFKPHISILLNITPDHLDRYNYSFDEYAEAKFKITKNQTAEDFFIYCADDKEITDRLERMNVSAQLIPFSHEKEVSNGGFIQHETLRINYKKNFYHVYTRARTVGKTQ